MGTKVISAAAFGILAFAWGLWSACRDGSRCCGARRGRGERVRPRWKRLGGERDTRIIGFFRGLQYAVPEGVIKGRTGRSVSSFAEVSSSRWMSSCTHKCPLGAWPFSADRPERFFPSASLARFALPRAKRSRHFSLLRGLSIARLFLRLRGINAANIVHQLAEPRGENPLQGDHQRDGPLDFQT